MSTTIEHSYGMSGEDHLHNYGETQDVTKEREDKMFTRILELSAAAAQKKLEQAAKKTNKANQRAVGAQTLTTEPHGDTTGVISKKQQKKFNKQERAKNNEMYEQHRDDTLLAQIALKNQKNHTKEVAVHKKIVQSEQAQHVKKVQQLALSERALVDRTKTQALFAVRKSNQLNTEQKEQMELAIEVQANKMRLDANENIGKTHGLFMKQEEKHRKLFKKEEDENARANAKTMALTKAYNDEKQKDYFHDFVLAVGFDKQHDNISMPGENDNYPSFFRRATDSNTRGIREFRARVAGG